MRIWRHLSRMVSAASFATSLTILALVSGAYSSVLAQDSLAIGMGLEPPHLDPTAGAAAAIDEVVYGNVFEGLTSIDQNGAVVPGLANSWGVSADGLEYLFNLEPNVTFHDGTPLTAEVVKFSLDRARGEGSTNAQKRLFDPISEIEIQGAQTIVIRLKEPFGGFLRNLGWGDAVIVHPNSAGTNKANPIGTGPYQVDRVVKGDRVVLRRFSDYWGTKPFFEQVTFRFIPDAAAQVTAMLAGDIDAVPNFGSPESLPRFEADPQFKVSIGTTEGETILALNNRTGPLSDIRVRRAIARAVDRQAIVDGAMFGYGTPIGSHFAPHHPAYVDLTGINDHDPDAAKALLREVGFEDGLTVSLILPPPTYARRGGEIVADQLRAVGIETEIEQVEWAQWLDRVFKKHNFDLTIVSHTEPLDIDIYTRPDYYFGYHDAGLKALLKALDNSSGPIKRAAIFGAIQEKIAADAPNVFLFQLAKLGVWRSDLVGFWENSPVQANNVTLVRRE
ncbi:MAG: ABC transporter substrate-binding protein [Pseudomonadota bacterium]